MSIRDGKFVERDEKWIRKPNSSDKHLRHLGRGRFTTHDGFAILDETGGCERRFAQGRYEGNKVKLEVEMR